MTTRTPPTADDIAGRTQAGRDAYNQRRRELRALGIATVPDLYDDDQLDDDSDPTGAQRFWRRLAAESDTTRAYDHETQTLVERAERRH